MAFLETSCAAGSVPIGKVHHVLSITEHCILVGFPTLVRRSERLGAEPFGFGIELFKRPLIVTNPSGHRLDLVDLRLKAVRSRPRRKR